MQFKFLPALLVFMGSYFPLSIILLVQDFDSTLFTWKICWSFFFSRSECSIPLLTPFISIPVLLACLLSFCLALFLIGKSENEREIKILDSKHIPVDLMNYVLPYVVSFISIDYQDTKKLIAYLLFFFWLFFITYKSGRIILNPMLTILGWRLYEVSYEESSTPRNMREQKKGLVLSNITITSGEFFESQSLQEVMVVKGAK